MKSQIVIIGSLGNIGSEVKNILEKEYLYDNVLVVNRNDFSNFRSIINNVTGKIVDIINCSNMELSNLQEVLEITKSIKGKEIRFWHLSSTQLGSTSYGIRKLNEEKLIASFPIQRNILRIGVPLREINGSLNGLGYWDTITVPLHSEKNLRLYSNITTNYIRISILVDLIINQVGISGTMTVVDIVLESKTTRLRLPSWLPYRRLNKLLQLYKTSIVA